jgi:hypothetical protein
MTPRTWYLVFVALLTVLEAGAAVTVLLDGDWKRAIYWSLAALMSASFML